jgi:hypothetical protein
MMPALSRWMMLRLMRSRAEKHSGCPIDVRRLADDPEYASAIRALAQFTLDEELQAICALARRSGAARHASGGSASLAQSLHSMYQHPGADAAGHATVDIASEAEADAPRPAHLAQVLQFPMRAAH